MRVYLYTAVSGPRDAPRNDIPCYGQRRLFVEPPLNAKIYKYLPHLFFPGYDAYIWCDANTTLTQPKEFYVTKYLEGYDLALKKHPERKNIFQEAQKIKSMPHLFRYSRNVLKQVEEYRRQGFVKDSLHNSFVIIRRNNRIVNDMCEKWWAHVTRWQCRDQVSLPFVLSQFPDLKVNVLERIEVRCVRHQC